MQNENHNFVKSYANCIIMIFVLFYLPPILSLVVVNFCLTSTVAFHTSDCCIYPSPESHCCRHCCITPPFPPCPNFCRHCHHCHCVIHSQKHHDKTTTQNCRRCSHCCCHIFDCCITPPPGILLLLLLLLLLPFSALPTVIFSGVVGVCAIDRRGYQQ